MSSRARLQQRARPRAAQRQRVTPRMVTAGAILQMSSAELRLRIEEESAVNPALEMVWDALCPSCGRGLSGGRCWFCESNPLPPGSDPDGHVDWGLSRYRARATGGDGAYDPLEQVRAPVDLCDHVLQQARLVVAGGEYAVAEYLVANLTDDGILETSVEEAAEATGAPLAHVDRVLSQLQDLDPPGVCARTVQEGALVQLRGLAAEGAVPGLAEAVVRHHWHDLASHSYAKIARELSASEEEVEEAASFIRGRLHPYPGRLFRSPFSDRPADGAAPALPDVIIRRQLADYVVEVVSPFDCELRVSEAYRRLVAQGRNSNGDSAEHYLALEQYRRATQLLQCVNQRVQTLREITECVVNFQRPFLDTGSQEKAKRLTRTQVARQIGKHPSTVSRAVANKFILLPRREVIAFDRFFSPAAAPKTIIAEVLSREDPKRPLTDEQICQILRVRGFRIARRTAAKYRLALRLPGSAQRGRH